MRLVLLVLILAGQSFAACFTVTASGSGTNSGADWNNAINGANLQTAVARGNVYYLAGGTYSHSTSSVIGYSFTTADSGTSTITIRAASSSDHCTDTGWSGGLAASSVNQVVMGCGAAGCTYNGTGYHIYISTDYWIFDGNGRTAIDSGYNMKVDDSWPNTFSNAIITDNNAHDITLQYIEFPGGGLDLGNVPDDNIGIASISCDVTGLIATLTLVGQRAHTYLYVGLWAAIAGVTNAGFNSAGTAANGTRIASFTSISDWTQSFTMSGQGYTCPASTSSSGGFLNGVQSGSANTFAFTNKAISGTVTTTGTAVHHTAGSNFLTSWPAGTPMLLWTGSGAFSSYNVIASVSGTADLTLQSAPAQGDGTYSYEVAFAKNDSFLNNYCHDITTCLSFERASNITITGNAFERTSSDATSFHAEIVADDGSSSVTIANNTFLDIEGTGAIVDLFRSGPLGLSSDWSIYGNVFAYSPGNPYHRTGIQNGLVSCINGVSCSNFHIYNNTAIGDATSGALTQALGWTSVNGVTGTVNTSGTAVAYVSGAKNFGALVGFGAGQPMLINGVQYTVASLTDATNLVLTTSAGTQTGVSSQIGAVIANNVVENNLAFNATQASGVWTNTLATTEDYNSYLQMATNAPSGPGAHDVIANAANPFVNLATNNFLLSAETSNLIGGLSLSPPYNVDPAGMTRGADGTWERGAYEFNSAASTPTFSAGIIIPQTVTISCSTGPTACYNFTGSPATNGTTGCTTGTLYSAPFTIAIPETIYAVCGGTGFTDSSVGTKTFVSPTALAIGPFASLWVSH